MPYSHIKKGTLIVATPEIEAGIFFRGVVLICEHNPNGSFGLVLNKELEIQLPEEIFPKQTGNPKVTIRAGGPVQTNQMMLLHDSPTIPAQTLEVSNGIFLGGDLQFLQDSLANAGGPRLNLCFGYAGWGTGQLEREFLDGHWLLYPCTAEHVFETDVENLWTEVLKEMGGKYASLAMIPEDLSLN